MMKLNDLLQGFSFEIVKGSPDVEITNVHFDSRGVEMGSLFVAQRGVHADGHIYINKAIESGAVAIVCEVIPEDLDCSVCYVKVENSSIALGFIASGFYGNPSSELKVVGVTGTNGKTTTATLLYELAGLLGCKSGLLSTVCNYIGKEKVHSTHTTPDSLEINRLMRQMLNDGCEYCFMEVSSHSAAQHRISGLNFTGAIFSNITHDHLDYHKTFKAYIDAKKSFFDQLPKSAFALTNIDDKNGMVMFQNTKARKYTYACKRMADFTCKTLEPHFDGTLLLIDDNEVWTRFTGDFNAYNLLAVYASAVLMGFEKEKVLQTMSLLVPVSGRFETIISGEGVMAIVDYAHTPDALKNVLSTIEGLKGNGKVITVVGAGGDRDKTKRPEMADMACRFSDRVILTSDNPRSEDPVTIIEDMRAGVPDVDKGKVLAITDRREAIRTGLMLAGRGDIVLIAGKGHEDYQEVKGVKHHFDDKEVVNEVFNQ